MRKLNVLLFSIIFCFQLSNSYAAIGFEDAIYPELATSGRALAMGNAFISKVDDSSAVYYNPAGLGSVRHAHLHFSNLHLETNRGWLNMGTGGKATDAATNFPKSFSLDGTRQLLVDNPGKISHGRFHFLPNFTSRYFSFGFLFSKQQRATMGKDSGAKFEYATRTDYGPFAALNLSVFGGIFKLGVSGTLLQRKEATGEAVAASTISLEDNDYKKGTMVYLTVGTKLTLPVTFLPTFAATIHNALDKGFSGRAAGAPTQVKQTVDLGFSVTPQIGKAVRVHLEANYKDLSQAYSGISAVRRLAMGLELDIARKFFLRVGYGDGFGSAGLGLKSQKLEFDLTTYAVDTTSSEFRGAEDRRFVMNLSSGF